MPVSSKFLTGLLLLSALAGCSDSANESTVAPKAALPVEIFIVGNQNAEREINAVGTVRYRRETPLGFTTAGKVAVVRFEEGELVKRGALLAALDTTNVGADMSVATAERDRVRAEFDRVRALYADGWITKARFEAAEATLKSAEARVRQAGFASSTAQLYAPSSGVVLMRNVQVGQVIAAGTPALILGEADEGFVFRVPIVDRDASKLRVGMAAAISIESASETPLTAMISEIDGRANAGTGAFSVQFRLPNQPTLRSGQIGTATIKLPSSDGDTQLQIPASALFGVRTGEGLVYVVDAKNRVETRNVIIQRVTDKFVNVSGGISPGDKIVTSGLEKLRTGSAVRIVKGLR
ncbi:efflux RND transporter periplasmic adaptor subunit [Sphingorhabdus wooponensis]|uniref:Efflux RND transporter periplasmic adaptor subunit n=1 Tax=Sphingorhabdus wooponensis TaxID=940136 RepID=A0A426RUH0_9SPHN|nr:efflux RND transporter periplasmic adaptor subunit [Sphingorhabdus wooponensis]RRQ52526.1 efflux RND transporter periplasmic adaptor subunit [Sphingorhabdus wooponensis]